MEIKTEILDSNKNQPTAVKSEHIPAIDIKSYEKNVEFNLIATIFSADMIHKSIVDNKHMSLEICMGNSGNNVDKCPMLATSAYDLISKDLG